MLLLANVLGGYFGDYENYVSIYDTDDSKIELVRLDYLRTCIFNGLKVKGYAPNSNLKKLNMFGNCSYSLEKGFLGVRDWTQDTIKEIPENVSILGKGLLDIGLNIKIPNSITLIDKNVFLMKTINELILSDNLVTLEEGAISRVLSLTKLNLPRHLSFVDESGLDDLCSLEELHFHEESKGVSFKDNNLCNTFITYLEVPNNCKFGKFCLNWNRSLEKLVIGDNCELDMHFGCNCGMLKTLIIGNNCIVDSYCFSGCALLTNLIVGDNCYIASDCFGDSSNLKNIKIGKNSVVKGRRPC